MWIVWTGGNDRFWDKFINITFGNFDCLKILSSYPGLKFSRDTRWDYFGLVNEPCFTKATGPNPDRYGLWLDTRRDPTASPIRSKRKEVSGREDRRARQDRARRFVLRLCKRDRGTAPVPKSRFRRSREEGLGSGPLLHGSELLQRQEARPALRVAMSCGFCHVGPNPVKPPADPENPEMGRTLIAGRRPVFLGGPHFHLQADPKNFIFQLTIRRARARSIRRWSRPTTSTTRGR
jgi:hypothetical protein